MRYVCAYAVVMSVAIAGPAPAQTRDAAQQVRQLKESRYQIGQMERLLEGAVEHGATVMRDQLRTVMPADMLLTENARARGFRLDGYGVFFDVEVPSLEGPLPWSFQSLDQNNLGIQTALQTLRSFIDGAGANDTNLQQAMKRVELQVTPIGTSVTNTSSAAAASPSTPGAHDQATAPPSGQMLPQTQGQANQAYRATISVALIDAMLEHSRGLGVAQNEWLTVAARGADDRPRLAPAATEGQTVLISVRGGDLTAFLGGHITREDALKRVEVRVF